MSARAWVVAFVSSGALASGGCHEDVTLGTDPPPFCQGKACGAPCSVDPCPGPMDCGAPTPGVCDGKVTCTASPPACALALPCQGMKCGATCTPPLMPMPPAGPFACNAEGLCASGAPSCPIDPCHGIPCGALCNPMCDPSVDGGCPPPPNAMACDMAGQCTAADTVACPAPCVGMPMCAPCMFCPPSSPMCMETPAPKKCDPSGLCTQAPMGCP